MSIYWIALLLAGLCEIGWPLGLKLSDLPNMKAWGLLLAIFSMALSGLLCGTRSKRYQLVRLMQYGLRLAQLALLPLAFWFLETPILQYAGLA
ncbi:MAG: Small Multidrug Resistance protein [Pseudomonadota bacterium]